MPSEKPRAGDAAGSGRTRVVQTNNTWCFWHFTRGQIAHLRRHGFDVTAITSRENLLDEDGAFAEALRRREDMEVHEVTLRRRMSPISDLRSMFQMWRIMRGVRPQVVQGGTPKSAFLALVAATLLRPRPGRVYLMRGVRTLEYTGWRRVLVRAVERATCACAHRVLCNSPSTRSAAAALRLAPMQKLQLVHNGTGNGVDTEHFDPDRFPAVDRDEVRRRLEIPPGADVVLFSGRISRDKGIVELADAWRRIRKAVDSAILVLAGPVDPDEPVPPECLRALAEDERVRLPGHVEDMAPLYAIATVLAHPSHHEGLPNAVLEASAMRVAVVAFDTRGSVDAIVDGRTGHVVPLRDAVAMAAAVVRLLGDPAERARLGDAGRRMVCERYRPEDVWEALMVAYRSVAGESRRA